MTSPLDGCHAKLRRAYQHLRSLDDAIQEWGKQTPYTPAVRIDDKSGEHVVTIAQVLEPPLLGWAVITGDALHNLRSALDHLVCVLARALSPPTSVGTRRFLFSGTSRSGTRAASHDLAPWTTPGPSIR